MINTLNFDKHIQKKCQIAHAQLRNIKAIRKHLTKESTASLAHELVYSHIDFCNGLFTDNLAYQIKKLQQVQNHAARVVLNATFEESINDPLKKVTLAPCRGQDDVQSFSCSISSNQWHSSNLNKRIVCTCSRTIQIKVKQ